MAVKMERENQNACAYDDDKTDEHGGADGHRHGHYSRVARRFMSRRRRLLPPTDTDTDTRSCLPLN